MKEYYFPMKKFNKNAQVLKYIIEHLSAKLGQKIIWQPCLNL